jgi:hypothetical protein
MIIRILPPECGATIGDEIGEIKVGGSRDADWSIGVVE